MFIHDINALFQKDDEIGNSIDTQEYMIEIIPQFINFYFAHNIADTQQVARVYLFITVL